MILIGASSLSLKDFREILFNTQEVELDPAALSKCRESFNFLRDFSKSSIIYGVNTGLGPMAQYRISEEEQIDLQYNLIRSHSSGCGNPLPDLSVKALMVARLNSLMKGYSGVHETILFQLKNFINRGIYPQIFEHGGVGASGDLVQLAHLALGLIGEGMGRFEGDVLPMSEILKKNQLEPATIHLREGLAVMNGTSAMTGIGIRNLINAYKLLNWSLAASCMINEVVESFDDHFSKELNQAKLHSGQQKIAAGMRNMLVDSDLVRKRSEHLYNKEIKDEVFSNKVQEYYSLRCVPQILGPVLETFSHAEAILIAEVNSANDNPIIDLESKNIYHGGNFHGDYISLEMDKVKTAVTKLSMLAERQINFLMNRNLNGKLPPFVNLGKLGLNFGMQGVQFTATSTVAENQTLSFPMYVHSIPNNNDNQDIVSMGANAALITDKVIQNSFDVLAIEMMSVLQAIDYLSYRKRLSSITGKIYEEIRGIFPAFVNDFPKYSNIQEVKAYLLGKDFKFL